MKKTLVIVESPAKIKTLQKFLGPEYIFASSIGHIRDLPQKDFGIDVDHDFDPTYVTMPDKKDVIATLKAESKKVDQVLLAPDPDREGEAIAWHIASILPKDTPIQRITFYSITKNQVLEALKHPRDIDESLVNAQQARRLLDRIVGYKISPILTRRVKRGRSGTSAGRVQSIALKFVVEREKEIEAFTSVEYWNIYVTFDGKKTFDSQLISVDGKKVDKESSGKKDIFVIPNKEIADNLVQKLASSSYSVNKIDKKEKKRNPVPPFITSTLQQEASRHYGFSANRTMNIAQGLYEGIDMDHEGTEGLITYMRTDSVQVSKEGIDNAREHILKEFGQDYLPEKPVIYKSKKSAQEAHEAIRPTNLQHPPDLIKKYLSADEYKLYLLIWRRFIASQMKPAIYDTMSVDIETSSNMVLRSTGSVIKFRGFLAVYEEKQDLVASDPKQNGAEILPPLEIGQNLTSKEIDPVQSFTKPPPRYTEASLVKELEKSGIGRPSTYASIMNKIQSREYTTKEGMALKPTELGRVIAEMLDANFHMVMDVEFTVKMEDELELIAEDKKDWKKVISEFWAYFNPYVEKAEKEAVVPKVDTDIKCPTCKKGHLQKIWSRNKYFYGCSNYPDCDFTEAVEGLNFDKSKYAEDFNWEQKCPNCEAEMTLRHGRFGPFLGCSKYPDCKGIVNIPKKGEEVMSPEDRPDCPAIGCDGKIMARKSRFGKTFFSCTNYPDCDVIVNDLDDLSTKYPDHPKTAYVKKAKGKRKKTTRKKSAKKATTTRTQPTYKLSKELSDVVGETELSRGQVMKKIWEYIKSHDLQDANNKRTINPDDKLAKVFGSSEPIDMMKMPGLLGPHFQK